MEKITVKVSKTMQKYDVVLGAGVLQTLPEFLEQNHKHKKIVIITDNTVERLHLAKIKTFLSEKNPLVISIASGEQSKSRAVKKQIEDKLLENKLGKHTIIISLGGGVVGDLAGFVASTFNRGIAIIHIPTTLLAMVDASIGGKTAINTKHGKNLIGTFWQPELVIADTNFLKTLPEEEFRNALTEIVKMGLILDKSLIELIEKSVDKIMKKDPKIVLQLIKRTINLKKQIVEKDAEDKGLRQILNFGHTIGHAIETALESSKHGLCICRGIIAEANISAKLGILPAKDLTRIKNLFETLKLPTTFDPNISTERLLEIMQLDKKSIKTKPRIVLLEKIGQTTNQNKSHCVNPNLIKSAIEELKNDTN